jgi:hypothetical protein
MTPNTEGHATELSNSADVTKVSSRVGMMSSIHDGLISRMTMIKRPEGMILTHLL